MIAGEKIPAGAAARIQETARAVTVSPEFLKTHSLRDSAKSKVFDVVERPHEAIDMIPYFARDAQIYVLGKQGFPRPILAAREKCPGRATWSEKGQRLVSTERTSRRDFQRSLRTGLSMRSRRATARRAVFSACARVKPEPNQRLDRGW